jgi:hypothetical protein
MTARIYSLHPIDGFRPLTLTGHRNHVVAVFFSEDAEKVRYTGRVGCGCESGEAMGRLVRSQCLMRQQQRRALALALAAPYSQAHGGDSRN